MLACLVHQSSEIRDLISCPPALSESRLFICNFRFGLHSDPLQYDPKKDLACMGDKSNCSVICTLFKIKILGKWDERGERPFLWPLTSFPDRHTCVFCPVLNGFPLLIVQIWQKFHVLVPGVTVLRERCHVCPTHPYYVQYNEISTPSWPSISYRK